MMGTISEACQAKLGRIVDMKNVYFLGTKNITLVPHYVKAFDVCIIPYRLTEETRNLNSLKLYDYLSLGKPVVTTDFPSARKFKDIVYINSAQPRFLNSIEKALSKSDFHLVKERRKIASENTWEKRVEEISRIITSNIVT